MLNQNNGCKRRMKYRLSPIWGFSILYIFYLLVAERFRGGIYPPGNRERPPICNFHGVVYTDT